MLDKYLSMLCDLPERERTILILLGPSLLLVLYAASVFEPFSH